MNSGWFGRQSSRLFGHSSTFVGAFASSAGEKSFDRASDDVSLWLFLQRRLRSFVGTVGESGLESLGFHLPSQTLQYEGFFFDARAVPDDPDDCVGPGLVQVTGQDVADEMRLFVVKGVPATQIL